MDPLGAAAALDVFMVENGQPAPAVLADRLDQGQVRAAPPPPAQAAPRSVLGPARQIGHEIDAEEPAAAQHPRRPTPASPAGRARGSATAGCRRAPSRSRSRAGVRNGSARMSPRTSRARPWSLARRSRWRPRSSISRRSVDADDRYAGPCHRYGDAAGAAAELEDRALLRRRQTLPERDVPAGDRLRVLPVVERRVAVPAFPAARRRRGPAPA